MKLVLVLTILALSVVACNRGDDDTTTTTAPPEAATTTTVSGVEGDPSDNTEAPTESTVESTTTTVPLIILDWDVRFKGQGDAGAIMVVEVPQGEATDRALENLLLEVLDEHDPVERLDVVDDPEAVELVRLDPEGLTEEEQQVLADHHLLNYDDGFVTFTGPFEEVPGYVYGS